MPCDTWTKPNQLKSERVEEVKKVVKAVAALIASGRVTMKVGKQGAVVFEGIPDGVRDKVTDACIYRRIIAAKDIPAVVRAKMLAAGPVNQQALAQGIHSHDGGQTWHKGH